MLETAKPAAQNGVTIHPYYDIATVRAASEIVAVIGDYVCLRRVGAAGRYVGLCALHREKTPSLHVDRSRQSYKCFGCGKHGDVFRFVMEVHGFSFPEAVRLLGERYGVTPARAWTEAQRRDYARRVAHANMEAARLLDWAKAKLRHIEGVLARETEATMTAGADPTAMLAGLHQAVHRLRTATAAELVGDYRRARATDSRELERLVGLGRRHSEDAERITWVLIDILARAKGAA